MSYFPEVDLNIFTFLKGERKIDKPIHKYFKELKIEQFEKAVDLLENYLKNFYKFLFSQEYKIQMEALATGRIMFDVKKYDLKNNIYFPLLNDAELDDMKEFVKQQEYFGN